MPTIPLPSRRNLCLAALALLALSFNATAATAAPGRDGEDVSAALEKIREDANLPGMVALAFQDGEVVAWGAAGVRAQGSEAKMTIDDPIHLGSCSKAMTATLVARLVEDEVLTWDTTIAQALPEFAKKIDEGYHDVSIETLLKHRGGIAERRRPAMGLFQLKLKTMEGTPVDVRREILQLVLTTPPLAPADNGFDYSNYGYMTVGAMLEKITGESWEDLMVTKVFGPLGMKSAGIGSPVGPGVPVGHEANGDTWTPLPPGPGGALPDAMSPAGLLHCNLRDWAGFVADHLAGERGVDGFVTAASYKRLHRDVNGSGYAGGWGLARHSWSWGNGDVLTHNGSDGTWLSLVFAMPEWDITLLVATNCAGPAAQPACDRARDLLLTTTGFKD